MNINTFAMFTQVDLVLGKADLAGVVIHVYRRMRYIFSENCVSKILRPGWSIPAEHRNLATGPKYM